MMFHNLAPTMNGIIQGTMFDQICEILSPNALGGWDSLGEFKCNIQASALSSSVEDPSVANSDDVKYTYIYIAPSAPIAPGFRVIWDDRIWNVGTENFERTTKGLTKAILTDWQIAVEPELVSFWRYRNGQKHDVGTYEVRVTLNDFSTLASAGRSAYQGDTAQGEIDTGTMVGGPELGVVLVGDWFIRDGLPGRVTSLLHRDEERARITFSLDRESR